MSARPLSAPLKRHRTPAPAVAAAFLLVGCFIGCDSAPDAAAITEDAVELWAHFDSLGLPIQAPIDLDLESRDVAWGLDRRIRAVMRYEASAGGAAMFGFANHPPVEVVDPVRLAVSPNQGIFVYDDSTGLVDLFTPDGQHIRSFDPGLRPAVLEVSRQPLRLTFGVQEPDADSIPHLTVIQTDFRGQHPDTLLSPEHGPGSLRLVVAVTGNVAVAPAKGGLWVYARQVPDTVFEVAAGGRGRKLALPEADSRRVGVAADLEQEILWVVSPSPAGGIDYEGYDLSESNPGDVIQGEGDYLGARITPPGFDPKVAHDGVVGGWSRSPQGVFSPRAYDMRVEDLRANAALARAGRAPRRAELDSAWRRIIREAATRQVEEQESLAEEGSEVETEPADRPTTGDEGTPIE